MGVDLCLEKRNALYVTQNFLKCQTERHPAPDVEEFRSTTLTMENGKKNIKILEVVGVGLFKPNVKKLKQKKDIEGLLKVLRDKGLRDNNMDIVSEAIRALGELKETSAVPVLMQVARLDSYFCWDIISALGMIGEETALEALGNFLHHPEDYIRQGAIWAIQQFGESAKPKLQTALYNDDEYVRKTAVRALGEIGDESTAWLLVDRMKEDESARIFGSSALINIGTPAVEPLIELLEDENPELRGSAVAALGEIRDERAIEPLIQALKDEDAEVREEASFVLRDLGGSDSYQGYE